ncbi:YcaO-like family protein [Lipingzhangella sp. LS1_29]|uniref:YcaO-like family protein n=1 Tax=Lipingzhangella rawalii TaxID=2055835 RepID=A0ABU2H5S0_9ACTN|nr:YcaO-like family protein [Lipingzhangella rawalii]MDS1270659.1 YcaO-like family protein [Lipingzhangella rawalii]
MLETTTPTRAPWLDDRPGPKHLHHGTHRATSLEETHRRLAPMLHRHGVTRIADITGLDLLGIPVATAVRPNSRSLSVSQGKGLSWEASWASAAMEAIEHDHAERPRLPLHLECTVDLDRVVEPWRLPRPPGHSIDPEQPLLWVPGARVADGAPVSVPFEAVSLDLTLPRSFLAGGIHRDSNGLAGGNTHLEAVLHALCELVERDAAALWDLRCSSKQAATRIDAATVTDAQAQWMLSAFATAGVEVALFDITSDIGLPTVLCHTVDAEPDPIRPLPPAAGMGAHPVAEVALQRAMTEAAQSRLIAISGARDDLTRAEFAASLDVGAAVELRDALRATAAHARPWNPQCGQRNDNLAADLDWLLAGLRRAGLAEPVAVDLTRPDTQIPVVAVVVPDLEGPGSVTGAETEPGPRARALAPAHHSEASATAGLDGPNPTDTEEA